MGILAFVYIDPQMDSIKNKSISPLRIIWISFLSTWGPLHCHFQPLPDRTPGLNPCEVPLRIWESDLMQEEA